MAAVDWVSCEATVVDEGEAMVMLAGLGESPWVKRVGLHGVMQP